MNTIQVACYIVATPIGNLGDISPRALEVLAEVKLIFAEDTRVSGLLLHHFGIKTPVKSLHEHNEEGRVQLIKAHLNDGEAVAIISDAGTPLISDPGYLVVNQLRVAGFAVIPIPGPSALIAALSVAGLPTDRFTFFGFLSAKKSERLKQLDALQAEKKTMVFYESSHRIKAMLNDCIAVFGPHHVAFIGREMTKRFESYQKGSLSFLLQELAENPKTIRGEFVVVLKGVAPQKRVNQTSISDEKILTTLLNETIPLKQAVKIAAKLSPTPKNELYTLALTLKPS